MLSVFDFFDADAVQIIHFKKELTSDLYLKISHDNMQIIFGNRTENFVVQRVEKHVFPGEFFVRMLDCLMDNILLRAEDDTLAGGFYYAFCKDFDCHITIHHTNQDYKLFKLQFEMRIEPCNTQILDMKGNNKD